MNDDDMTLKITIESTIRIPLVKKLIQDYLDSFLDISITYPPSPQTGREDDIPGRPRMAIHG